MTTEDINGEQVYKMLKQKYTDECIDKIPAHLTSIKNNNQNYNLKVELDKLQEICNTLYTKYGASNEIIQYQALINSIRYTYDIPDDNELIYEHEDGRFAQ